MSLFAIRVHVRSNTRFFLTWTGHFMQNSMATITLSLALSWTNDRFWFSIYAVSDSRPVTEYERRQKHLLVVCQFVIGRSENLRYY